MGWPTTTNPRKNFVTIRLTDDEAKALDALAASKGESRSAVMRDAVTSYIARKTGAVKRAKKGTKAHG